MRVALEGATIDDVTSWYRMGAPTDKTEQLEQLEQHAEPQATVEVDSSWYNRPLFYQLDAVDFGVLAVIGLVWACLVWVVAQAIRTRLEWAKPYTRRQFVILAWVPLVGSAIGALATFPTVLDGLGAGYEPALWESGAVGFVGGCLAKYAHDGVKARLPRLFDAVTTRLESLIGGNKPRVRNDGEC